MFSSSRTLVPLFVYLSLILSFANAHDVSVIQRDHANLNMKRLMRKRSPVPAGGDLSLGDLFPPVAGAAASPSLSQSSASTSATPSQSLTSSASSASESASASASGSSTSASGSTTSSASSVSASSASSTSSTSSASTTAPPQTSESLNLTGTPNSVSTVIGNTITRTASVDAAQDTSVPAPLSGVAKTKSTTLTVLIAVAASVGGLAILWTIFRKWKLSSSKKFDERLNPIDWQPTTGEDDGIPRHRRVPSGASSLRSGSGHGHNNGGFAPLDHDFTAGPANSAPVGGYADLARGSSPTMQENITRGPSFNRGYGNSVPLHNQAGYGSNEGYRY